MILSHRELSSEYKLLYDLAFSTCSCPQLVNFSIHFHLFNLLSFYVKSTENQIWNWKDSVCSLSNNLSTAICLYNNWSAAICQRSCRPFRKCHLFYKDFLKGMMAWGSNIMGNTFWRHWSISEVHIPIQYTLNLPGDHMWSQVTKTEILSYWMFTEIILTIKAVARINCKYFSHFSWKPKDF